MTLLVVGQFLEYIAKIYDKAEEGEGSISWPARVDALIATVIRCLTKRQTQRGQRTM